MFLILNALLNPTFEADERENQDTLCEIKPRLHRQGGFSSKDSVRSWSPKRLLHFISPSASSMVPLQRELLQSAVQSRRTALFCECITEEQRGRPQRKTTGSTQAAHKATYLAWHILGTLLVSPGSLHEVALSSLPLREDSFQDAAGRV